MKKFVIALLSLVFVLMVAALGNAAWGIYKDRKDRKLEARIDAELEAAKQRAIEKVDNENPFAYGQILGKKHCRAGREKMSESDMDMICREKGWLDAAIDYKLDESARKSFGIGYREGYRQVLME